MTPVRVAVACHRKTPHATFDLARQSAVHRMPQDGRPLYVYRCGDHFHVTHKDGPEVVWRPDAGLMRRLGVGAAERVAR